MITAAFLMKCLRDQPVLANTSQPQIHRNLRGVSMQGLLDLEKLARQINDKIEDEEEGR